MKRAAWLCLMAVAACAAPSGTATVSPDGSARGAVTSGAVTVGAGEGGAAASVKVVDTDQTDVSVGTHGASVAVSPRGWPFRLGVGTGGVSLGF